MSAAVAAAGERPRVGVSACLLGEPVRYNAGHCRFELVLALGEMVELVRVCPEEEAGLGVPRESMRLVGDRLVGQSGADRTPLLTVYSRERVDAFAREPLDGFILKKSSPTCGMERVRVYDPSTGIPRTDGVGLFARELMRRWPDMPVEEEGRLTDPHLREHFLTRVFASHRWRAFVASAPRPRDLVAFHASHKLLLHAHDPERYRALGRIVARAGRADFDALLAEYGESFARALKRAPTRGRHADVMQHLLGYVKDVSIEERADLLATIEEYRGGLVPLAVPARLLLHHARRESAWAADQLWFAPWPPQARLRVEV